MELEPLTEVSEWTMVSKLHRDSHNVNSLHDALAKHRSTLSHSRVAPQEVIPACDHQTL